jgi:amino acid adenylation domain-containing protein
VTACWHEAFKAQAQRSPDAAALATGERSLSYDELDRLANALAHRLVGMGVGPEKLVAIRGDRSLETIVAVLGVLKAGGAFVPLDPSYPAERLAYMLDDCGAGLLLSRERAGSDRFHETRTCVDLDGLLDVDSAAWPVAPSAGVQPSNLAYVIYTSGSTGRPKGTLIEHRGLSNTAEAHRRVYGLTSRDRVLQFSSLSFDAFISEMILALGSGACLCLAPIEEMMPGEPLRELIRQRKITAAVLTPTVLAATEPAGLDHLRVVTAAGEACSAEIVRRWAPGRRFLNAYGPAEASIWASSAECLPDGRPPSIGEAIPGCELYVLDSELRPVANGQTGELYLGGLGVARGYLGQPALTAERFIPDPFGRHAGGRLYRTGDLVRGQPPAGLMFVGRADFQVKIRGIRIELGEIEAVLLRAPGVRQAVVLERRNPDEVADSSLVAYVAGDDTKDEASLRGWLAATLPSHMLPSRLVRLPGLPLTPNGKVDREALPTPDDGGPDTVARQPRTPVEALLVTAWQEVLRRPQVGIDEDFFAVGGHSLLAARVTAQLRAVLGIQVPHTLLFEHRTIADLAPVVERLSDSQPRAEPPSRRPPESGPAPLSFSQERVWFLEKIASGNLAYSAQALIRFRGRLEIAALKRALQHIVDRHEVLRTSFPERDGTPMQVVHDPWPVRLPVVDLSGLHDGERERSLRELVDQAIRQPFDPTTLPLVRWTMYRLGADEHALLHAEHHFVHDGWSFNVFLDELFACYRAELEGRTVTLPPLPIQFGDFAAWQRRWMQGPEAAGQLAWWRETLAAIPSALEIPTDRPRPAVQTFAGDALRIRLPATLCDGLRGLARRESVTLFMTFLAGLSLLLHRWCREDDVVLGSALANRRWQETERLIGMMLNTVALRIDLSGNPTCRELLGRVRQATLGAYRHQDIPFERVVEEIRPERTLSRNPIFQIMCAFHDAPLPEVDVPELQVELEEALNNGSAKFDLGFTIIPRAEQVVREMADREVIVICEYNTDLFDRATVERLVACYRRVLTALVETPNCPVADVDLLDPAERRRQAVDWNRTAVDSDGRGLLDLFASQVQDTPRSVAVRSGDRSLTYVELSALTARLANRLRFVGVGPEARVGVCLDRSPELVASLLGVLAAGGAYVPIDPHYPQERIEYMVRDAGLGAVVTQRALRDRLPVPKEVAVIDMEAFVTESAGAAGQRSELPHERARPDQLAYVIYTSGSTGLPKGVAVSHGALANLLRAMQTRLGFAFTDVLGAVTPVSFDIAALELFLPLIVGATVVVYDRASSLDPSVLASRLEADGITVLQATPITWRLLVDSGWPGLPRLLALCGGEALPENLAKDLRSRCRELWNLYGPTETTIWSTASRVEAGPISIGGPIANTRLHVLDPYLQPVPVGVAGELCIGGSGLARGYLDRPGLTAERFVPDPLSSAPGARLYRTGDLVRRRPDGGLEFHGRVDNQVKVRGHRIELGEIEAALKRHPAIADVAVAVRTEGSGDAGVAAYVVWKPGRATSTAAVLAASRDILPDYMVPSTVTALPELPRTPNDKVDRKALPEPDSADGGGVRPALPRTPMERAVAGIWQSVLGVGRVGVSENFFDVGGHSLLMVQVHRRLRETFSSSVSLVDLFGQPTIRDMAAAVAGGSEPASFDRRRERALARRRHLTSSQPREDRGVPSLRGRGGEP